MTGVDDETYGNLFNFHRYGGNDPFFLHCVVLVVHYATDESRWKMKQARVSRVVGPLC
jgi:hypothetical protein